MLVRERFYRRGFAIIRRCIQTRMSSRAGSGPGVWSRRRSAYGIGCGPRSSRHKLGTVMRAVIFDYGNVLCRPQHRTEVDAMAAILNLPRDRFEEIYWRDRLTYDEGKLDSAEYWNFFRPVTRAQIEQLNRLDGMSWTYPDPVMPDWARQLREDAFRIALLS